MKALVSDLKARIKDPISTEDLSKLLFQLGHENDIYNNIIDIDITPNRGDCLSILGILRDLKNFYEIDTKYDIYDEELSSFNLKFTNENIDSCPRISFLKIDIGQVSTDYEEYLENFFSELDNKKINLFTDISNYLSYELGQPTHCYDFSKINSEIVLKTTSETNRFKTLTGKEIELSGNNLVFKMNKSVINLAGVMGGIDTACSNSTKTALIECAYFEPESIIGKTLKYDLNSEAAHKFERGTDSDSQEYVLRRFIKIVSDHAEIKNLEFISYNFKDLNKKEIKNDKDKIERILGTTFKENEFNRILENLGFQINENSINIPSFRNDISTLNDIAEEVARIIGYDNLPSKDINLYKFQNVKFSKSKETFIRKKLTKEGFSEVINNPFTDINAENCFKVDNPLDSNRNSIRNSLKGSLIKNLLYNERRQKDSIKLFEISDVYTKGDEKALLQKKLGIIASGRIGNNYEEFSRFINDLYLKNIVDSNLLVSDSIIENISRENLETKIKTPILFTEIDLKAITSQEEDASLLNQIKKEIKYEKISEFPSINRDISFLIKNKEKIIALYELVNKFEDELLREKFIFDFYSDKKSNSTKVGYRFIFQSKEKTLTVNEVDVVLKKIIETITCDRDIEVPGY